MFPLNSSCILPSLCVVSPLFDLCLLSLCVSCSLCNPSAFQVPSAFPVFLALHLCSPCIQSMLPAFHRRSLCITFVFFLCSLKSVFPLQQLLHLCLIWFMCSVFPLHFHCVPFLVSILCYLRSLGVPSVFPRCSLSSWFIILS